MDDSGVSSNLAFIIASGILLASITSVYTSTQELGDAGAVRTAEQIVLQSEARSLRDVLLGTPGLALNGTDIVPWNVSDDITDQLLELGLLEPGGTQIDFDKLSNLRRAKYAANATDGRANYEEVEAGFNYDSLGLGFHIRAKPALDTVDEILSGTGNKDDNLLVSYIGNVTKQTGNVAVDIDDGLVVENLRCAISPIDAYSLRYSVDVTNGGTVATQFLTVFDIFTDFTAGDDESVEPYISRQGQTYIINATDTAEAWVDVNYGPGDPEDRVDCDGTDHVAVEVWDSSNLLRRETLGAPAGAATPSVAPGEFYAEIDDTYYASTDTATVRYAGNMVEKNDVITMTVYKGVDHLGPVVYSSVNVAKNSPSQWKFTFDEANMFSPKSPVGEYTVVVEHEDGIKSSQRLLIAPSVNPYTPPGAGASTYEEDPALRLEVEMIDAMMGKFCPFFYDNPATPLSTRLESQDWNTRCSSFKPGTPPTQLQGDVYPDLKDELEALVTQLEYPGTEVPRYDYVSMLVVGSNVAHNSMTTGNFKWPLQRWVEGGGTLIVFGSPAQSTNWLNPIFGIKETSSGSGLSAPDAGHSLLTVPEALPYDTYDTNGQGWTLTSGDADAFTSVVKEGDVPVTVVSEPGAYGNGTIILTTWQPYDATGTGDASAGMMMMNNFLKQGYQDLFLDYGPPLPTGVPVIPALGFGQVVHPKLPDPVSLRFTIYVFPYSG